MVTLKNEKGEKWMQVNDENKKPAKKRLHGRPKKGIKRSEILMIRLTPTERLLIEDKSKKAGVKPSEWFRRAAKSAGIVPRFSTEESGWYRLLAGLANNLNQLTRLAHVEGLLSLSVKCRTMLTQVDELMLKMTKHDR
ncbi:plasmid mobilization protein [Pedobacter cryoconitis]|uniref:plasmid mobilization protein n=1 Tax=Pedobacter cryoconitis TaxID=188932 RepID=UPI00161B6364|nr:plasmid mobilization relaxosome protein MobC [Pedobacter cryoconitis]MBB5647653.1 hypothetical protein [Pedobacter cryoconitis]